MTTIDEEIASLLGLLALHRGEVVEISLRFNEWFLAEGTVPAIEDTLSCWCEQFLCFPTTPVPQAKQFWQIAPPPASGSGAAASQRART